MNQIGNNIFRPQGCELYLESDISMGGPFKAWIESIEQYAGASMGSAVVRYPCDRADNATRSMGAVARITIGGSTVFRGAVGHGPFVIKLSEDEVRLVLFDDKWRMASRKIGQPGIGTAGASGFTDVGLDVVFNKDGRPNKSPSSGDFSLAQTAVLWTLKDIITFIFNEYVPTNVARLSQDQLAGSGWSRTPTNLDFCGQSSVQAVEMLTQLAGESWALVPGTEHSSYRSVKPGTGTVRHIYLYRPGLGSSVAAVTDSHTSDAEVALSIQNCRDTFHVVSGNVVKETCYSIANGLLAISDSPSTGYKKRFSAVVTRYATNYLGANRVSGALPKPWLPRLLTRVKSSTAYYTAEEIYSNPALEHAETAEIPVWISIDGTADNAKLVSGGYRIDPEKAALDLASEVEVFGATRDEKVRLTITNWAALGVWTTVATVLEQVVSLSTRDDQQYLPEPVVELIRRTDLIPEYRRLSTLPDLSSSNPHALLLLAHPGEGLPAVDEVYVSVTTRLQAALSAASDGSVEIESPITATLPFFPVWQIGDRVSIVGRTTGATGKEVITKIVYACHDTYETTIEATNVMAAVDPERFVEKRK